MFNKKLRKKQGPFQDKWSLDYVEPETIEPEEFPLDPKYFNNELRGSPYQPDETAGKPKGDIPRSENTVIFLDIETGGGRKLRTGEVTKRRLIGRLNFELRQDLCPIVCANFLLLIEGSRGVGNDGVLYHYKGSRIFRAVKDKLFTAGDLLDEHGNCSRSTYNEGGLFKDENFVLRHVGPGCLSMANRGPNTNGSIFQVTFSATPDLDERCVVFGALAHVDSYEVLANINNLSTPCGEPLEELTIIDCGVAYPDPEAKERKIREKSRLALKKQADLQDAHIKKTQQAALEKERKDQQDRLDATMKNSF